MKNHSWFKKIIALIFSLKFITFGLLSFSGVCVFYSIYELNEYYVFYPMSSDSLKIFLKVFLQYSEIFSATIIVVGLKIAVDQFELSRQSAKDAAMFIEKNIWINTIKIFIDQRINSDEGRFSKDKNPYMYRHISLLLPELFSELFPKRFVIKNKTELRKFVLKFFKNYIKGFEQTHPTYIESAGNQFPKISYSCHSFNDIMITILKWDEYEGDVSLRKDLERIYFEVLKNQSLN